MKNFFVKIKNWFVAHWPTRRRLIQVYTALLYNANIRGYIDGRIFQGNTKYVCVPGMNCYSCPGAVGACPLGSLQNALSASATRTSYYVFGIIGLYALLFARTICGFLCPIGFGQELLYKIKTPKLRKSRVTRVLSYLKYALLAVLVIALPLMYSFAASPMPGFCKYICPAGTFEGGLGLLLNPKNQTGSQSLLDMLGPIFTWKFIVLVVIIVASVLMYRPFCRFLCPLGAIYGFFNGIALMGVKLDENKCTDCGLCVQHCKMDVKHVGDHECINCGECIKVCPAKAISWKGSKIFVRGNDIPEPVPSVEIPLGEIKKLNFNSISPAFAAANGAPVSNIEFKPFRPIMIEDKKPTAQNASAESPANDEPTENKESANETSSERVSKTASEPKQSGNAPSPKRDKTFWMRAGAWTAALALLLVGILYFNVFAVDNTVIKAGTEVGDSLDPFAATMYDDTEMDFETFLGEHGTVIVLWDDSEAGIAQVETVQTAYDEFKADFPDFTESMKIYAFTSISTGKELVEDNGWTDYDITFGSMKESDGLAERFGADVLTIVLDKNGIIKSKSVVSDSETAYTAFCEPYKVPEVGMLCPDFEVKIFGYDDDDNFKLLETTVHPSDYLGQVLVINFWGTWCTPCVGELPHFNRIANENDDVTVLAVHGKITEDVAVYINKKVDVDEDGNVVGEWLDYNVTFAMDNLQGNDALVYKLFEGDGNYPMTYIIDKTGKISFIRKGSITYDQLSFRVQEALNA